MINYLSKLLNLTSGDLLEVLSKKVNQIIPVDSKSALLQMVECCFYANHIPEWIWSELSTKQKNQFKKKPPKSGFKNSIEKYEKYKKRFINTCARESKHYKIVKDLCNSSKHVTFFASYNSITKAVQSMVNIHPEVQYYMQTGKKLEKDEEGNYDVDVISINMDYAEIFIDYEDSNNFREKIRFWDLIQECQKYLIALSERYLKKIS